METWKDVVGFEGRYKVSDEGRVIKVATGKVLKTAKYAHGGYHKAELRDALGGIRREYVHRLVLEAFIGPCPDSHECRHLDGNPSNNNVGNLAWGTKEENQNDKIRHGTWVPKEKRLPCTHGGPRRKLSEEQFAALLKDRADGMTQKAVAEKYGMSLGWVGLVDQGVIKHRGEPRAPEGYRAPLPLCRRSHRRPKSPRGKSVPG